MLWLRSSCATIPGRINPTLVIVTDRTDLDDQITKTFRACGFRNPSRPRACATCASCFPGRRARPS